jgi:hypothetical protein
MANWSSWLRKLPGGFPVAGKAMLAVAHDSGMMSIYTGLGTCPGAWMSGLISVPAMFWVTPDRLLPAWEWVIIFMMPRNSVS